MSTINYKSDFLTVDELRKVQLSYPRASMTVVGHTDSTGIDEVNQILSVARATTVVKSLLSRGGSVDKKMGYGERAPLATNRTEEGRAQNRRVVSTVYGLTYAESLELVKFAQESDHLFVISVENEKIENLVKEMEEEKKQVETLEVPLQVEVVEKVYEEEVDDTKTDSALAEPLASDLWDKNRYSLKLESSYSFIQASDITGAGLGVDADWVSEPNYGILLAYQYNIQKNYWLGLETGVEFQKYEGESNINYSWDRENPTLTNFAIVLDYEKNNFGLGLNLQARQQAFVAESASFITLSSDWVYSVVGEANYLLFERRGLRSRLGFDLILPFANSGDVELTGSPAGFNLRCDISRKTLGSSEVMVGLFYSVLHFELSQGKQSTQNAGARVSLRSSKWF